MNDRDTRDGQRRLLWLLYLLLGVWIALGIVAPLWFHGLEILILWMTLFLLFVATLVATLLLLRKTRRRPSEEPMGASTHSS